MDATFENPPQTREALKAGITQALNARKTGIMAMRSAAQFKASGVLDYSRQLKLGESVLGPNCDASLYQILDNEDRPWHLNRESAETQNPAGAVRGFLLVFTWNRLTLECFFMDEGGSRAFYDAKTPDEQREFAEKHAQRMRSKFVYDNEELSGTPDAYFVMIGEENGQYRVEQVVPYISDLTAVNQ